MSTKEQIQKLESELAYYENDLHEHEEYMDQSGIDSHNAKINDLKAELIKYRSIAELEEWKRDPKDIDTSKPFSQGSRWRLTKLLRQAKSDLQMLGKEEFSSNIKINEIPSLEEFLTFPIYSEIEAELLGPRLRTPANVFASQRQDRDQLLSLEDAKSFVLNVSVFLEDVLISGVPVPGDIDLNRTAPDFEIIPDIDTRAQEWVLVRRNQNVQELIGELVPLLEEIVRRHGGDNRPDSERELSKIELAQFVTVLETTINVLQSPMVEKGLLDKTKDGLNDTLKGAAKGEMQAAARTLYREAINKLSELIQTIPWPL